MGKIRVKTFGDEEAEKKQKEEAKKRKEARLQRLTRSDSGQAKIAEEITPSIEASEVVEKKSEKKAAPKTQSQRYKDMAMKVDRNKTYQLTEAVSLLKSLPATKFDATVELHINTISKGISGQVTLPHGTGKTVRVTVADSANAAEFEALLKKIESGTIEFDVLLATPPSMARLAKVAKILGPKGLMPNPKNGTITEDPKRLALSYAKGQVNFKTESEAPIIHTVVGKLSFKEKDLEDNIKEFVKAVGSSKVQNVTLKSTMSPGIRLDYASL